ncbi:tRNA (guanine-N(7)-)-methyltransferase non-catalytic subunit trm82 [Aspergillus nanangensis]|uniref:tRNA (Guanine-N(7)-)-methyltransferase non-catalytic subunit trm82 n=1 Tax=Aspergillus nanangensis TaxID=2582783 RepID=A0AAD4GRR9_ASPNN|nr:tRNA (guanine-N(7)-)-methyltransferase non-catalytic subunit trm82 [Aspergillus nanangensis]
MAGFFQIPFQTITFVDRDHAVAPSLLISSAGAKLYSYAAETGERLASWPQDVAVDSSKAIGTEASSEGQGPPGKRRKVSEPSDQAAEGPTESQKVTWSNIPIVLASSNGQYVIALTAEDKCIRVFQLSPEGTFQQLSQRTMPKKPGSIILADNERSIVAADKFGDVYSLPLIASSEPYVPTQRPRAKNTEGPAATNLTVHTKRNLEALEQQKLYKNQNKQEPQKTALSFEHQLLLGHVSLLTDVAFVALPVDASSGQKRTYLLSADRDEHIRVSRGPPQTHIIENYCFGHTAFVSKLCIPHWAPEFLVSGGGDNFLLLWKWAEGRLLQKIPLVESDATIVVRGIWAATFGNSPEVSRVILVAIEGSSQLRCFGLESDGTMKSQAPVQLSGNVLDVAISEKDSTITVAVDSIREPQSTQEWRASPSSILLEAFHAKPNASCLEWEPAAETVVAKINTTGTSDIPATADQKQKKELNDMFYSLGNLRKSAGEYLFRARKLSESRKVALIQFILDAAKIPDGVLAVGNVFGPNSILEIVGGESGTTGTTPLVFNT